MQSLALWLQDFYSGRDMTSLIFISMVTWYHSHGYPVPFPWSPSTIPMVAWYHSHGHPVPFSWSPGTIPMIAQYHSHGRLVPFPWSPGTIPMVAQYHSHGRLVPFPCSPSLVPRPLPPFTSGIGPGNICNQNCYKLLQESAAPITLHHSCTWQNVMLAWCTMDWARPSHEYTSVVSVARLETSETWERYSLHCWVRLEKGTCRSGLRD